MPKRVLTGTVVSDKPDKTVVVRVERRVKHPLYGKIIRLSKKYHAHDEGNVYRAGEQVRIEECAPMSKQKTWTVLERIGAARPADIEIVELRNGQAGRRSQGREAGRSRSRKPRPRSPPKAEKKPAQKADKPAKAEPKTEKTATTAKDKPAKAAKSKPVKA